MWCCYAINTAVREREKEHSEEVKGLIKREKKKGKEKAEDDPRQM